MLNIRMPFAQDNERDKLSEKEWGFLGGGKGDPAFLWEHIDAALASGDFQAYIDALSDGREKVIIFNIPDQTWRASRDLFSIARMKTGSYQGLLHEPWVFSPGRGLQESDVYNYLYCVARAGMDCSGFVWHVLSYLGKAGGVDLGRALGLKTGENPAAYASTWFYNSRSSQIEGVVDEIRNLRPGDILLFRGRDGEMAHSAVIQSVDLAAGLLRYLQCTDEAPLPERGVHESFIRFDPAKPEASLKDPSLEWSQKRYAPFPGEASSPFADDGSRYRAYPELGGGRVVRIKALRDTLINSEFNH